MNSQESDTNENVKFPTTQLFVLGGFYPITFSFKPTFLMNTILTMNSIMQDCRARGPDVRLSICLRHDEAYGRHCQQKRGFLCRNFYRLFLFGGDHDCLHVGITLRPDRQEASSSPGMCRDHHLVAGDGVFDKYVVGNIGKSFWWWFERKYWRRSNYGGGIGHKSQA